MRTSTDPILHIGRQCSMQSREEISSIEIYIPGEVLYYLSANRGAASFEKTAHPALQETLDQHT